MTVYSFQADELTGLLFGAFALGVSVAVGALYLNEIRIVRSLRRKHEGRDSGEFFFEP